MDYMELMGKRESFSLGKAIGGAFGGIGGKVGGDVAGSAGSKALAGAVENAVAKAGAGAAESAAAKAAAGAAEAAAAKAAAGAAENATAKAAAGAAENATAKAAAGAAENAGTKAGAGAAENAGTKAGGDAVDDAAENAAKKAGKKEGFGDSAGKFAKSNPALVIAGLGIAAATTLALTKANAIEGKQVGIIKVEKADAGGFLGIGANNKLLDITYSEAVDIRTNDNIVIASSNATPSIDGSYTPTKIHSSTKIQIETSEETTVMGPGGTITIHTSVESQLIGLAGDAGETIGGAAGGAAGGVLDGAAKSLGMDPATFKKVLIGVGAAIAILVIIGIILKMKKR